MDLAPTIRGVQAKLGLDVDGIAGPLTWTAIAKALDVDFASAELPPTDTELAVDKQSEESIATLALPVQPMARRLVHLARLGGIDARVISGYRTYEQQEKLYKAYKNGTGGRAAPPGHSNHNFAVAFDVGIFDSMGRYIDEFLPEKEVARIYWTVGKIGKSLGLLWGGDWSGDSDMPHFEYRPAWAADMSESEALAAYRERAANGETILT